MQNGPSRPAKAAIFYVITLALAIAVAAFSGVFGESSPVVTMVTPAIAVLIMLFVVTREGRSRSAWVDLGVTRLGLNGWWLAILGPAAILVISDAVLILTGLASLQAPVIGGSAGSIAINLALGLAVGLVFAFTEEVGWRGYMLPHLSSVGVVPAMLVVGFLHGVWHLPLMLTTPYYHSGGNPMAVVPLFLITLTLAGIAYGYLRVWTGSVWPVAIAHAVYGFIWGLGSEFITVGSPETMEYIGGESGILAIAGLIIAAIVLIPRLRSMGRASGGMAIEGRT